MKKSGIVGKIIKKSTGKSMKASAKKLTYFIASLVLCLSSVACSNGKETKQNSLDRIKSKGVLVVGTAPGYPPFEFVKSNNGKGEVVGADIDLAQKIADKLGVKLEVKAMEFDSILGALQANKIDIALTSMTPTEERKKSLDFSDVYYEGGNLVLVSASSDKKIKSIDYLKNSKIGVQKGSTQEIFVKDELKAPKTKSLTSIPDLITDIKNGNIDSIVVNSEVAKINAKSDKGIKLLDSLNLKSGKGNDTAALAIKKGDNKDFLEEVNRVINDLRNSREYDNIIEKNIDIAVKTRLDK